MLTLCHNFFRVQTNNKSNKDGPQQFSRRKFVLGVFLIILVDILWVASSELTKYIYSEKKLERPFLVTYVRSSFLFVYLIVLCFTPPTKDPCRPVDYTQLLEPTVETDDENFNNDSANNLGDPSYVPVRVGTGAGETTDSDDAAPRAVRFNKVAEVRVMSAAVAGEALLARLSWQASVRASQHAQRTAAAVATRRHLRLALVFSMPWFVSQYLYHVALLHCGTAATVVFAGSAAPLAAVAVAVVAREPLTAPRCLSVLLQLIAVVVSCTGGGGGGWVQWRGTTAAVGAGAVYAVHLVMLRRELRRGDNINSPLFVGLVGCACGGAGWALGGVVWGAGGEPPTLPAPAVWSWLLIGAAAGPLLTESLWLWGRSLVGDGVATGLLAATLPLAAVAEAGRGGGTSAHTLGAAVLGAAAWALAYAEWPPTAATLVPHWLGTWRGRGRRTDGFVALRNTAELDEQSEALMSADDT